MGCNYNLHRAKKVKCDEFYTRLEDIIAEIGEHKDYHQHFKDKAVYLNCDSEQSAFWQFFKERFYDFGLKRLIATHYEKGGQSYKVELSGVNTIKSPLKGDGDFRSDECVEILKEADIVVTNPPFSLFREYVAQLIEHKKDFIILGNMNALTYKEIFSLLKENKVWLGCRNLSKDMYFNVPDERKEWLVKNKKEGSAYKIVNGVVMGRLASACWFTNLDHSKRHALLETAYLYSKKDILYPDLYPKYDNYDAINVNKTAEIPMDYDGVIGVPITFMDKFNPEQFEIVKFRKGDDDKDLSVDGKCPYFRILIRKKEGTNND